MNVVSEEELAFKHPFSMLLSGSRRTGKTTFVKTLLLRNRQFILPTIEWIFWIAPTRQEDVVSELEQALGNVTYVNGLPDEDIVEFVQTRMGRKLIVLDDLMEEAGTRKDVKNLFTRGRYEDISVILLSQNDFHQGKHYLEMSRNTDYPIIFRNIRNASIITTYATQMGMKDFLPKAYKDATREPFSYLLLDMRSDTDDRLRFRANVFKDYPVVYTEKSI